MTYEEREKKKLKVRRYKEQEIKIKTTHHGPQTLISISFRLV